MRGMCVGPINSYKGEIQIAEHSILWYPGLHNYFNNYFFTLTLIIKTVPHCINYLLKVYDSIWKCDCFSFASKTGKNTMWILLIIKNYERGSGMAWHILHKSSFKKKTKKKMSITGLMHFTCSFQRNTIDKLHCFIHETGIVRTRSRIVRTT